LSLQNVSVSFSTDIKIKPFQPWRGEKVKPFFLYSNTDVFIECPFNEN
jgi:hypothetical protein